MQPPGQGERRSLRAAGRKWPPTATGAVLIVGSAIAFALDGPVARLFAGCGIVADSDPDNEVREAAAKLLAVREVMEPRS